MRQAVKEEQEIWDWVQDKHVPRLAKKTGLTTTPIYYFKHGKAKNPSFHLIRSLQLIKDKEQ
jgi:hypothetical protein